MFTDMPTHVKQPEHDTGAPAPIARLYEDILLKIFLENTAKTYSWKRLTTARHTSQVCQRWRTMMIHSPSIWGKLIDLDDLGYSTDDWFREVISRAGQALLWIAGPIKTWNQRTAPDSILTFVSQNWENVQRFDVSDFHRYPPSEEDKNDSDRRQYWTTLLARRAPNLEEFVFHFAASHHDILSDEPWSPEPWLLPSPLFDAHAPVLTTFEAYRFSDTQYNSTFTMDMPLSWFSRLRSFRLKQSVDLPQLLTILNMVPFLEDLEIHGTASSFTGHLEHNTISMVALSRLESIRLESWTLFDIAPFLNRISPSAGCCLSLLHPDLSSIDNLDSDKMTHLEEVIMQYVEDYFANHPATQLYVSNDGTYLKLQDRSHSRTRLLLHIWIFISKVDTSIVQNLLTAPFFFSVRELDLQNFQDIHLYSFSAFSSVTTLVMELDSFSSLQRGEQHNMFPQLRIVKVGEKNDFIQATLRSIYREPIYMFLKQRRDIGRPLTVLDLSALSPAALLCDLDNIEEFTGLVVRWLSFNRTDGVRIKEYKCGTGRQEELCFREEPMWKPGTSGSYGYPVFLHKDGWSGEI